MNSSFSSCFLGLASLFVLSALVDTSQAFTATTSPIDSRCGSKMRITRLSSSPRIAYAFTEVKPFTELQARNKDVSSEDRGSDKVNNIIGIDRGVYLFAIVMAINVWFFSIPVEFRRTRICNEADSRDYPKLCMTPKQFTTGISDYYKNGKKWSEEKYSNFVLISF